jgi:DNA-binding NarL/FixJ family response regulator
MAVTVLIVDDHEGFRTSARSLLEADGFHVVADAPNGDAALDAVVRLKPALVLLDIQLPGADGFEVLERLARLPDAPAVVLISTRESFSVRRRVAATAARGFVRKDELSAAALAEILRQ